MKIRFSSLMPPKGFVAINLFGTLVWRKDRIDLLSDPASSFRILNHEEVHTAQMRDFCSFIPIGGAIFYIIYFLEWLYKVLFVYPFSKMAYRMVSFEQEAYLHQYDSSYIKYRKRFTQWIE